MVINITTIMVKCITAYLANTPSIGQPFTWLEHCSACHPQPATWFAARPQGWCQGSNRCSHRHRGFQDAPPALSHPAPNPAGTSQSANGKTSYLQSLLQMYDVGFPCLEGKRVRSLSLKKKRYSEYRIERLHQHFISTGRAQTKEWETILIWKYSTVIQWYCLTSQPYNNSSVQPCY